MRFLKFFALIALIGVAFSSCKNVMPGKTSLKTETDSLSYCLGVNIGSSMKNFEIPKINPEILGNTVQEIIEGKEPKIKPEKAAEFINKYFMKLQAEVSKKNLKEGEEFLTKNKERKGVITTPSGVQYEVVKEGTGPKPKADDYVSVQYKGTFIDGTTFDSSYERGTPAQFMVSGVIPGWTEVLQMMNVGSKWKVYLPSALAYGERGGGKIKPNSTLIFEIELLSIDKKPPQASQPQAPSSKRK